MRSRWRSVGLAAAAVLAAVWFNRAEPADGKLVWREVTPGVYHTASTPPGFAIVSGRKALLIDAAVPPDLAQRLPADAIAGVLLTHHHRDAVRYAAEYVKAGVPVRAGMASAEWLTPENVTKFWADSIPLRDSRANYFVVPEGVAGIEYTLEDGKPFPFGEWLVTPVSTPGHSRDHLAFLVKPADDVNGLRLVFCGDALHSAGKLWTPFTTDWDHWTDAGLKPAAESLRKLAKLNPTHLFPAHGEAVTKDAAKALTVTAAAVDEAAFLKSFERFTNRLGSPPQYPFLVPKEQVGSGGREPWSKVSDHLWITGNTYVLKAVDGPGCLVLDPWAERIAGRVEQLRAAEKLGPVEVVSFTHAHYDHFDGHYYLPERNRVQVWGLDVVAGPLKEPLRFRAPFLDARPIAFTKELKDGDTTTWGGYTFKYHHFPGQSWFTSAIETTIDGKRCLFTADNFFHQNQYSGSGGWMGLNRSSPAMYAASARKVLTIAPDGVLAEHGGPFVFDAEDFRRRVKWAEAAGKACDALCVSGDHRADWTPHRVTVEPAAQTAPPGGRVTVQVRLAGAGGAGLMTLAARGPGSVEPDRMSVAAGNREGPAGRFLVKLPPDLRPGRYIYAVEVKDVTGAEPVDTWFAIDVK